jgi:hypothetical protein
VRPIVLGAILEDARTHPKLAHLTDDDMAEIMRTSGIYYLTSTDTIVVPALAGTGEIGHVVIGAQPASGAPSGGSATDGDKPAPPAGPTAGEPAASAPKATPLADPEVLKHILGVTSSDVLWKHATAAGGDDAARELARKAISTAVDEGAHFTHRAAGAIDFDAELLDMLSDIERHTLALKLLEMRNGLHQAQIDGQHVTLADTQIKLAWQNVSFAEKRNRILDELIGQLTAWKRLAYVGALALVAFLVIGGLLAFDAFDLVRDGKMDGWSLPVALFALAVFIISPAMLLIRERPLKGIDEWKPGGKSDASGDGGSGGSGGDAAGAESSGSGAGAGKKK